MKLKHIKLRRATISDADNLLKWKNDKTVREYSLVTKDKIKKIDHLQWLNKRIKDIWIIELDSIAIGDIRYDGDEIAIKLDKDYRGKGIGKLVIKNLTVKGIKAKIAEGNIASMRLFIGCGYRPVEHHKDHYIFQYV